jgi:hypothetical protein
VNLRRRPSGPLVFSIAAHVALAFVILNAAFHYNFYVEPRQPPPAAEHVTYVAVTPGGSATGSTVGGAPARATVPSPGLVAPLRVPTSVVPSPRDVGGTAGGVEKGKGVGGGVGPATGVVPADPDPRLVTDAHQFFPVPKTHAERVDSAVKATIGAFNDSVAVARANAGREPGDWTFEKGGGKWGMDGKNIYLGKFAIPSAVLAALPLKIQGNPYEANADRLQGTRRGDLLDHAASQYHDDEFKTAVKRIRERKDRERRERLGIAATDASAPDAHQ